MATEPLGFASVGAYGNAEFLRGIWIAVTDLAYLNLPNLRFPTRIKDSNTECNTQFRYRLFEY